MTQEGCNSSSMWNCFIVECCLWSNKSEVLATAIASFISIWWVIARHADYAWILQDFMGFCVCHVFLVNMQLPSLKVATVLLGLFFLYDIFMVFISPSIFGASVMVEVATGGGANQPSNVPSGKTECTRWVGEGSLLSCRTFFLSCHMDSTPRPFLFLRHTQARCRGNADSAPAPPFQLDRRLYHARAR